MKDQEINEEDISAILETLMINSSPETQYVISGSGWGWFLDPDTYEFVRTSRGTEILPLPGDFDDKDRMLVKTQYRFLLIPKNEVQEIGWN